jgi:hypothetical protein
MKNASFLTNVLLLTLVGLFAYWVYISDERNRNVLSSMDLIRGEYNFNERSVKQSKPSEPQQTIGLSSDELTLEQYNQFLEIQSQQDKENAIELFDLLYSEKGIFAQLGKIGEKDEKRKKLQITEIEKEIQHLISNLNKTNIKQAKLELSLISWTPIGNTSIDKQMTIYYNNKITKLLNTIQ